MDWIWIWVAVIAVSLIIEFSTMELVSLWTAIGGIIALILSTLDVPLEFQLVTFFAVSIILLLSLRKIALKYLLKSQNVKVGTDSIIGSTQKLLTEITDDNNGTVKINGITWTTITINGDELPAGTMVEIVEIKGNKLIVKRKENKD